MQALRALTGGDDPDVWRVVFWVGMDVREHASRPSQSKPATPCGCGSVLSRAIRGGCHFYSIYNLCYPGWRVPDCRGGRSLRQFESRACALRHFFFYFLSTRR